MKNDIQVEPLKINVYCCICRASTSYCLVDEVLRHGEIVSDKEKNDILIFPSQCQKNKDVFFFKMCTNHVEFDRFPH